MQRPIDRRGWYQAPICLQRKDRCVACDALLCGDRTGQTGGAAPAGEQLQAVAEESIKQALPGQRKAAIVERELRREFVNRWGGRPITDISKHDVIAVLKEAVDRGAPYQAHNLLGHVRRLFNWAIGQDVYGLENSACDRMKPKDVIGKKKTRSRTLTDDELRAAWRVAGRLGYPFGDAYRLLLLTGQRKSEVFEARWSEFDLAKKIWVIPVERMKGEEDEALPHAAPLTAEAMAILEDLPRFKRGDHLFSTTFGQVPVSDFSKSKGAARPGDVENMARARPHHGRRSPQRTVQAVGGA
jgi:integrase